MSVVCPRCGGEIESGDLSSSDRDLEDELRVVLDELESEACDIRGHVAVLAEVLGELPEPSRGRAAASVRALELWFAPTPEANQ